MDIQLIQNYNNPTLNNAWLSGFSDSEGCFTINVIKQSDIQSSSRTIYFITKR